MNEVLTLKEIEAKYDQKWVTIIDVQTNEHYQLLGGTVVYYGDSRGEAYQRLDEHETKFFAVRWIGEFESDEILIL